MAKIVLISCVSKKLDRKAKAGEIYISPLFKYALKYASSFNPDKIFILSAKYGLLNLEDEIEPYEKTLNSMKTQEIKEWANNILEKLKQQTSLEQDEFIFLAGKNYRKFLTSKMKNYSAPLKNLGIGKQLKFLKENSK